MNLISSPGQDGQNKDQSGSFRTGDKVILERYFRSHSSILYYYVHRLVENKHDAEDIIADTFYNLLKSNQTIDDPLNFAGYLHRAARNTTRNYFRQKKREGIMRANLSLLDNDDYLDTQIIAADQFRWISRQLKNLRSSEREVIELYYLQGKTYQEIAKIRSCDVQTVRNLRADAIKKLLALSSGYQILIVIFWLSSFIRLIINLLAIPFK